MSEAVELKPCPFCNSAAEVIFVTGEAFDWWACCTNKHCGAKIRFTANSSDKADPRRSAAIAAWNTRPSPDAGEPVVLRAAICEALLNAFPMDDKQADAYAAVAAKVATRPVDTEPHP